MVRIWPAKRIPKPAFCSPACKERFQHPAPDVPKSEEWLRRFDGGRTGLRKRKGLRRISEDQRTVGNRSYALSNVGGDAVTPVTFSPVRLVCVCDVSLWHRLPCDFFLASRELCWGFRFPGKRGILLRAYWKVGTCRTELSHGPSLHTHRRLRADSRSGVYHHGTPHSLQSHDTLLF